MYHTLVTDKGVQQLKQALPGYVIHYSRGSREGALNMKRIAAILAIVLMATSAWAADEDIAASVEKQGGYVVRDQKGNIIEVSLARTWATDADVERVATIKTLKKLDLSLTYMSDAGAEAISKLAQLEELDSFTAEFVTDAAVAFCAVTRICAC